MENTISGKKVLILIITGFMLFAACLGGIYTKSHAAEAANEAILGSSNGKSYVNNYFNIKIPLYKNMTAADDAKLAADNGVDANGYTAEKRLAAINSCEPTFVQHYETPRKDLVVLVGRFSSDEEKKSFEQDFLKERLAYAVDDWKKDPDFTDVTGEITKINCLGKTRPVALVKAKYNGYDYTLVEFLYVKNDYYIHFAISGLGTNQVELLQKAKRAYKQ